MAPAVYEGVGEGEGVVAVAVEDDHAATAAEGGDLGTPMFFATWYCETHRLQELLQEDFTGVYGGQFPAGQELSHYLSAFSTSRGPKRLTPRAGDTPPVGVQMAKVTRRPSAPGNRSALA